MLIQLLTQHPEALGSIVKNTPAWVWGLLAALLALGISQMADRELTLRRVILIPLAMLGLALYGIFSAFGSGGQLAGALFTWLVATAISAALVRRVPAPAGTVYDARSGQFSVQGSSAPLLLILGIFLTKYAVGVELAMQASQARDAAFVLPVALIYGVFNGIFTGRALQPLRLLDAQTPRALGWLGSRLFARRDPS